MADSIAQNDSGPVSREQVLQVTRQSRRRQQQEAHYLDGDETPAAIDGVVEAKGATTAPPTIAPPNNRYQGRVAGHGNLDAHFQHLG